MSETNLIARACETLEGYLALGNERFDACGATFIRNRATPSRYDANTICLIRDALQVEGLLARAGIEYSHLDYRNFHVDPLTPPAVEARLALGGFARWSTHLVMVLEGALRAEPRAFEIRPVKTDDDWQAYGALQETEQAEYRDRLGRPQSPPDGEYLSYVRVKSPPVSTWLAYADDLPRAYVSSWPGEAGVGFIEDLFTHPACRHQGLGTALVAHAVADARSRGAGPVVLMADPTDTPKDMYAPMGFRPLFVHRSQYR